MSRIYPVLIVLSLALAACTGTATSTAAGGDREFRMASAGDLHGPGLSGQPHRGGR